MAKKWLDSNDMDIPAGVLREATDGYGRAVVAFACPKLEFCCPCVVRLIVSEFITFPSWCCAGGPTAGYREIGLRRSGQSFGKLISGYHAGAFGRDHLPRDFLISPSARYLGAGYRNETRTRCVLLEAGFALSLGCFYCVSVCRALFNLFIDCVVKRKAIHNDSNSKRDKKRE